MRFRFRVKQPKNSRIKAPTTVNSGGWGFFIQKTTSQQVRKDYSVSAQNQIPAKAVDAMRTQHNPFRDGEVGRRNDLMVWTTYGLELHAGEILGLWMEAIAFNSRPELSVVRRHDYPLDRSAVFTPTVDRRNSSCAA